MEGNTEPIVLGTMASGALSLSVQQGTTPPRLVLLNRSIRLGSADDNDVVIHDRAVSAHHCVLRPSDGGVLVEDLGSRNGTWVDGVRVVAGRTREGGRLRLGRTDVAIVASATKKTLSEDGLVAASNSMKRVLLDVDRFANLSWPVLVLGESGAGKEGVARALHRRGSRAQKPFVAINAGSITRELVESELFGHEKGAFTGALHTHRGVFEQAHTGTLFLDEIGELPLEMQSRLLRVLETWEVRRVGSPVHVRVDVRLICATHRDLLGMAAEHRFRLDLYYRLTRLVIDIPPLRERHADVRALSLHFLRAIEKDVGLRELTDDAMNRLLAYPWPGNARELRNVLSGAAAFATSSLIDVDDVERALSRISSVPPPPTAHTGPLARVLAEHAGNASAAARALGIPRSTLRDRLKAGAKTSDS